MARSHSLLEHRARHIGLPQGVRFHRDIIDDRPGAQHGWYMTLDGQQHYLGFSLEQALTQLEQIHAKTEARS
jgi:hypothetical protein